MMAMAPLPPRAPAGFMRRILCMPSEFVLAGGAYLLPPAWMISYGLGLLATWHFAPRSIGVLGGAFLVAGLFSAVQIATWDIFTMSGPMESVTLEYETITFGYAAEKPDKKGVDGFVEHQWDLKTNK